MRDMPITVMKPLPRIEDLEPIGPSDDALFEELRLVLKAHGAEKRFGITLLHEHFDLKDGEILVESIDVKNRTLTCEPHKVEHVADAVETSWRLDGEDATRVCETLCRQERSPMDGEMYHDSRHYTTS